jgi:hypothetical protein
MRCEKDSGSTQILLLECICTVELRVRLKKNDIESVSYAAWEPGSEDLPLLGCTSQLDDHNRWLHLTS